MTSLARRLLRVPAYLPFIVWLAVVGWQGVARGGIAPGSALDHLLPSWVVMMWTVAVAAGATLAVVGGVSARTRVESTGLALILYGVVLYGGVGAYAVSHGTWSVISVASAFGLSALLRLFVLSRARHAQEVAADLSEEG